MTDGMSEDDVKDDTHEKKTSVGERHRSDDVVTTRGFRYMYDDDGGQVNTLECIHESIWR